MVMPRTPGRGGARRISVGFFIRDELIRLGESYEAQLYGDYKNLLKTTALSGESLTVSKGANKGKVRNSKRRVMSYEGFRNYVRMAKRLGLIEEVVEGGVIKTAPSANPNLSPIRYIRLAPGAAGSGAWQDMISALGYR